MSGKILQINYKLSGPRAEYEKERGGLFLSGDPGLARSMGRWLRTSVYAALEGIVPLS